MKLRIILDSTANLRPGLEERFAILPLTLRFGEEEYLDGVTMDAHGFYEKLVESDVLPTTSQASPYAFEELFRKELAQADELLDKYVRDSASVWADRVEQLPQTIIGSVVGTHAGPGAVAVAFFPMS